MVMKSNGLKNTNKRKYWYQEDVYACVLCGKEKRYRYRVYEKPENPIIWKDDACPTHFI